MIGMHFCHRHERAWYYEYGRTDDEVVELMSSPKQVVKGCANCHDKIDGKDHNIVDYKQLRERKFKELRGDE